MSRTLFYFPLESVKSRYTQQLCEIWMPNSFKQFPWKVETIKGKELQEKDIKVGHVLDSVGRSVYSFSQIQNFLENFLEKGLVRENDILFFQDFWTPGIEAIYYALNLYGIKVKTYSMLHAQSVDEYDFTYSMKSWMRDFELGIDKVHSGIFVGSTIHRDQLRAAGFKAPIHVMSLPIDEEDVKPEGKIVKKKQVVFSSRMNTEKNPLFMIRVAEEFLKWQPSYTWVCTTSSSNFRSDDLRIINELYSLAKRQPRFILAKDLSKEEYYNILRESNIQFNCSLQDYVSWTLLEAANFNCNLVYPNFRSFPECMSRVGSHELYVPFVLKTAVKALDQMTNQGSAYNHSILEVSDMGRRFESYIMYEDIEKEFNVWTDYDYMKYLMDKK